MFIRTKKKAEDRTSVQIVENIRDGDKIKQRIIRHVGVSYSDKELVRLKDLATYIKLSLETVSQPTLIPEEELAEIAINHRKAKEREEEELRVNLKALREESRISIGIHEVCGHIYQQLGFDNLFNVRNKSSKNYLRHIVMARLSKPSSKLASVKLLEEDFGIRLNLDMVYRMMDKIDDKLIDKIKDISYINGKKLLGEKFDIIFYDATTLYFESFKEDELKANGYSKDMKFNQPQLLLAVMVSRDGIPMGYELFPGNCFEGHTLKVAIERINAKYNINKIYIVADRGLLSEENLSYLEKSGHKYIVGARLKNSKTSIKSEVLDLSAYEEEGDIKYREIKDNDKLRKIISHYCSARAKKDKYDREKSVNKIIKKIKNSKDPLSLVSNYGYKKYINVTGKSEVKLNEEKIEQDSQWDGICGIITNDMEINPREALGHYKGLWQIEETFRISKHDLKIRPIFHWTPKRIKSHIAICYIGLVCIRHLQYRTKVQYQQLSPARIIDCLSRIQITFLKHQQTQEQYAIPSAVSKDAAKIYNIILGRKISTVPFKVS